MYSPTQQSVFPQSAPNLRDKTKCCSLPQFEIISPVWSCGYQSTLSANYHSGSRLIDFNTCQRSLAGDCSFLKDLLKLMNNSVFGKTQESLRNRVHVELVTNACLSCKRVAKPTFYRCKPITDCLNAIQSKVGTLTLNRPIYVGSTMLELSKLNISIIII